MEEVEGKIVSKEARMYWWFQKLILNIEPSRFKLNWVKELSNNEEKNPVTPGLELVDPCQWLKS